MSSIAPVAEDAERDDVPALVVTFGTTARRRRLLSKPTSLLGRGKGCDIRLDAVEISTVHCIISHTATGLAIRDCESRVGTLVNEQPIREGTLRDGDVLQLGPFSFRVHIPSEWSGPGREDTANLGAAETRNHPADATDLSEVAERIFAIEERERELDRERGELERQRARFEEERQERDLAGFADLGTVADLQRQLDQARADLAAAHDRIETLEAYQAQWERELAETRRTIESSSLAPPDPLPVPSSASDEVAFLRAELAKTSEELAGARVALSQALANTGSEPLDGSRLAAEIERLRKQSAESGLLQEQLQRRLETEHDDHERRLTVLREELERERMQVKQLVREAASQYASSQAEMEGLRQQLAAVSNGQAAAPIASEEYVRQLEYEVEALRGTVGQLEAQLGAAQAPQPALPAELAEYENQLHEFRAQLEQAQEGLARQEAELQDRIRQNELQISRERAEVARERANMERVRHELKSELEHAEREAKNLERLSGIHKLAQERRGSVKEETPANSLSAKVRGFLKRIGE